MDILEKIKNHSAHVGVVGLGYVGLPLAVLQAKTGFHVFGVDEVAAKVEMVNQGNNYILDVLDEELREVVERIGILNRLFGRAEKYQRTR